MGKWWTTIFFSLAIIFVAGGIVYQIKRSEPSETPKPRKETPLSAPTIKITDPQRGPDNAPLTIVYFSDFGCRSCAGAEPILSALEKEFPGKLRFVWKDFSTHQNVYPESYELHKAARCAATAGKFWEFQRIAAIHIDEVELNKPVVDRVIEETGLNPTEIKKCMRLPGIEGALKENEQEARRLGITATPTFFFDGMRYEGIMPYYQFAGTIRKILARIASEQP